MSGLLSRSARIEWPDDRMINEEAFRYYGRLSRVQRYVEAHYSEAIPLELAARLARLEKKYFSVFFHKKTGIPYSRWLAAVRVRKAIELMCRTDDSLTHVGHAVGFREFRTFQRTFKKLTGITLREFRKQAPFRQSVRTVEHADRSRADVRITKSVADFKPNVALRRPT